MQSLLPAPRGAISPFLWGTLMARADSENCHGDPLPKRAGLSPSPALLWENCSSPRGQRSHGVRPARASVFPNLPPRDGLGSRIQDCETALTQAGRGHGEWTWNARRSTLVGQRAELGGPLREPREDPRPSSRPRVLVDLCGMVLDVTRQARSQGCGPPTLRWSGPASGLQVPKIRSKKLELRRRPSVGCQVPSGQP